MRGLAVLLLSLGAASCGGQTNRNPAEPVSVDASSAIDGDTSCGPGEKLCDVCGTLGCYAGACPNVDCAFGCPPGELACNVCGTLSCYSGPCPMHTCPAPVTCPPGLPGPGGSCDQEGVTCGYETSTSACGVADCDCQSGKWTCRPSCAIADAEAGADGGGDDGGSDDDGGPAHAFDSPSPGVSLCTICGSTAFFAGECPPPPPSCPDE